MSRVVILDRDGVINEDSPAYVKSPEEWHPIPGSLEAMARLTAGGFKVYIATNQAAVGRGLITREVLEAIHARLTASVESAGGRIDGLAYCPHHPDDGCGCRKPAPGLIHALARDHGFDPVSVPFVGDSRRDIDAAEAAGCEPLLVRTGNGRETEIVRPDVRAFDDLAAVADCLLGRTDR